MTKKQEKKKNVLNKNDFDIGIYTFEDLYTLLTLTAFFAKKYKVDNIVNFYKKVYPDSSFIHIENYEKINLLFQNFYNAEFDQDKEFNNMGLEDKDILKKILEILKSMLPF